MLRPGQSNGYEENASAFMTERRAIGASLVAEWSRILPGGGAILDLGCGTGVPVSRALIERGFQVHGVDASSTMVREFRRSFPNVPVECAAVENSDFFNRTFDAVIAWGLVFLLSADAQRTLIRKIGTVLAKDGRLLFTAPSLSCSWSDAITGRTSISLGYRVYRHALEAAGMSLVGACRDEGGNHYYHAQKRAQAEVQTLGRTEGPVRK
jgi:SAM-dependent methyltransferase